MLSVARYFHSLSTASVTPRCGVCVGRGWLGRWTGWRVWRGRVKEDGARKESKRNGREE